MLGDKDKAMKNDFIYDFSKKHDNVISSISQNKAIVNKWFAENQSFIETTAAYNIQPVTNAENIVNRQPNLPHENAEKFAGRDENQIYRYPDLPAEENAEEGPEDIESGYGSDSESRVEVAENENRGVEFQIFYRIVSTSLSKAWTDDQEQPVCPGNSSSNKSDPDKAFEARVEDASCRANDDCEIRNSDLDSDAGVTSSLRGSQEHGRVTPPTVEQNSNTTQSIDMETDSTWTTTEKV